MKKLLVCSQFSSVIPVLVLMMTLASGCGKKFEANTDAYRAAPPATSDPLTAEDQRRWDAAAENLVQVEPVLESAFEVEAFMNDITEQAPAHSEDELAEEAERIHQERKQSKTRKPLPVPTESLDMEDVDDAQADSAAKHEVEKPTEQSNPTDSKNDTKTETKAEAKPETASETKPDSKKDSTEPRGPSRPVREPKPAVEASKAPPTVAVPKKEELQSRPARPTSSIGSEFCKKINVMSSTTNTDTSHLYNTEKASSPKSLPSSELAAAPSAEKKNRFVCLILPIAIRLNEEIYRMRIEVLRLQAKNKKGIAFEAEETEWLSKMSKSYGAPGERNFAELLKRVDIVPLALLLSQAAVESGWGTSNATKHLNNIFGIHAFGNQPYKLGYDTNNAKMRLFPSIEASISGYLETLNTQRHYTKFRDLRASMRANRQGLDSVKLMKTLDKYSERKEEYINNVIEIMTKSNKLTQFVFKEGEVKISKPQSE